MIDWLCSALDLALVEEIEDGGVRLNRAAAELLGVPSCPSLGAALQRFAQGALETASLEARVRRARMGERSELVLPQGASILFAPIADGRACAVLRPTGLTDRAALERRADATDRSARVSHELANALGAIAGWARLAREGADVGEALELIEKSAETAWGAARAVLGEVSGGRSPQPGERGIDMSAFVDEAARLLLPKALKKHISVRTSVTPGLCIEGDRSSAWTIVWNLATNAVEALPEGGTVNLQLTATGKLVHLCVTDNGPGMRDDVKERVFEPYFTTKRAGTGLGLSLVKQAVAELGGTLHLTSEPGKGTHFQIDLPRALHAEKPGRRAHSSGKRASGVFVTDKLEGRFLVIDDDAGLREMIATALHMRGAEVVVAQDLREAMRQQVPFDLVIVDCMLGGERGDVALARLRGARLAERGLLVTGAEIPRTLARGGEPDAVLRKPFELDELFERIAEVLGGRERTRTAAS